MKPDLHIERLQVNLRGVPVATARAAIAELGPALQQAIAARAHGGVTENRSARGPATVTVPAGADAAAIRAAVVRYITNSLPF